MSGIMSMVLGAKTAIAAAVDAYFNLVTLLLPGDGTNGAQNNTFLDSSSNNFTITRNGNTTQGTFSPFSQTGWSNYFDGSGDYLSGIGTTSSFNFMHSSSSLFTFETWVYVTSLATEQVFFDTNNGTSANAGVSIGARATTGNLFLYVTNGSASICLADSTSGVTANSWNHIAITYDQSQASSNAKFYVNGVAAGTGNKTANTPSAGNAGYAAVIGRIANTANYYVTGYISNLRICNAVVYSSAFTPSTTPLTTTSQSATNCKLLTCQSNRFIDNSSNAFAITANGDVSVQAFSPFAPTAAYSAATNGGSGYFDGTGDYVNPNSTSANLALGSGDFTVEFWVYTSRGATRQYIFDFRSDAAGGKISPVTAPVLVWGDDGADGNGNWLRYVSVSNGSAVANADLLGVTLSTLSNQWNHIAVVRSSGTVYGYLNGVRKNSVADSTNYNVNCSVTVGAANDVSTSFLGNFSGFRVVKGTAVYTGTTYTVPTAPPTAITNTQLLLNYTNAGITDATAKNDLETVGNAQISTTQSKFGGSSMYFDGTGDRLLAATSPLYDLGSGNWTVECWVYASNLSSMRGVFAKRGNADGEVRWINSAINTNGTIYTEIATSSSAWGIQASTTTAISATTWAHIAWVRNGSDVSVYVNGTKNTLSSSFTSSVYNGTEPFVLGANGTSGSTYFYQMNGYIDDFRITRGYARYTATFTPPTEAFALQ